MKKVLAVFFGGKTVEHDISIVTGHQFIENIDKSRYDVVPVYIARDGHWFSGEKVLDINFLREFNPNDKGVFSVYLPPVPGSALVCPQAQSGLFSKKQRDIPFDVAVLSMHGLNGEDGTLQGLMELADVPYVGSGVLGSAAGMDKVLMKAAFKGAGLPVLESIDFLRDEWEANQDKIIALIESVLEYPMFVKPANLGSSIGISKATDRDKLYEAIEVAVRYDRRILVDQGVEQIAEYNCSALGFGGDVRTSVCEEPLSWQEFLTFEEKYLASEGRSGMKSMGRIIPAPISDELSNEIREMSDRIFKLFDCKGVVRIDFIYDKAAERIYANEINTIPGSFAYYLWEASGMKFSALIDELVSYAMKAHKEKGLNNYAYDSDVLKKAKFGSKSKLGKR